jgi:hypothetical protein
MTGIDIYAIFLLCWTIYLIAWEREKYLIKSLYQEKNWNLQDRELQLRFKQEELTERERLMDIFEE